MRMFLMQKIFSNNSGPLFRFFKRSLNQNLDRFEMTDDVRFENQMKLYQKRTSNRFICLNNRKLAEIICQKISEKINSDEKLIYEAAPGQGILTQCLLNQTDKKIRVFENDYTKKNVLQRLQTNYGDRLEIIDRQILDFSNGFYKLLGIERDEMLRTCFDDLTIFDGIKDQRSYLLFAALSPFLAREFLSYLIYSLIHSETFFQNNHRNEFYLFVPVSVLKTMVGQPSKNLRYYTSFTINLNTLFSFEVLDFSSLDIEGLNQIKINNQFYSIFSARNFVYTNERKFKSKENFVFIHLKASDLIDQVDNETLIDYFSFIRQSFVKRSNNVIEFYDKIFPGCAAELIRLNISYFKSMGDLTIEEILIIFNYLHSLNEYQNSIFREFQ